MDSGSKVTVRLPAELHREIEQLAEQEDRSLNGEIVNLLRDAVERRKKLLGKSD